MSLLGARDGEARDYTEVAEALASFVGDPERDLEELFERVAFSIAVNNTDDHLRNHGFLRAGGRWRLSPACSHACGALRGFVRGRPIRPLPWAILNP